MFIAFDIYDKKKKKFYSVAERNKALEGSGIPIVRTVAQGVFTKEQYLNFLETDSIYHDGKLEGVYVRIDDGEHNLHR